MATTIEGEWREPTPAERRLHDGYAAPSITSAQVRHRPLLRPTPDEEEAERIRRWRVASREPTWTERLTVFDVNDRRRVHVPDWWL